MGWGRKRRKRRAFGERAAEDLNVETEGDSPHEIGDSRREDDRLGFGDSFVFARRRGAFDGDSRNRPSIPSPRVFFFWRIESPEFTTVSPFVIMRATRVILALGLVVASAATASAVNSGNTVYAHATNGVVTDGSGNWEAAGANRRCACSSDAPHFLRVR